MRRGGLGADREVSGLRDFWGVGWDGIWGGEKGVYLIRMLSFVWTAVFFRSETSIRVLRPWRCAVGDSRSVQRCGKQGCIRECTLYPPC